MKPSRLASLLCTVALALLVLSFSIAVPILFRPFYYVQIDALDLPERTGWSEEVIREAYDEVLDFCVLGKPFGTGQLAWSESGRSHFADVRELFLIDFAVLALSAVVCALLLGLRLNGKLRFHHPLGRGPGFWAGVLAAGLVAVVGGLAALDFERAFVVFHAIFFPGKDNWLFDPATDQIILVMPEEFFRNCAILIGVVLLVCCAGLIAADLLRRRKQ
ncbi:TIGR01906 family membrane protein [Flavonifractor sp. HCP28S3_F3]|uniref:TIGR01906 family membrane protein n=1 Tax=Flavonifractor sp. HCP28S3_F3 TaxID=3438939 RepID=UPI003F89C56B